MSWEFTDDRDPKEMLQDYKRERTELIRQLWEARDIEGNLRKTLTTNSDEIKRLRRQVDGLREAN